MTYFVYIDKTDLGEVFYVGKGDKMRLRSYRRNKKHKRISATYGCKREVVWQTEDELEALAHEERLIEFFGTFSTDWSNLTLGCNFTTGGQGVSGRKMSSAGKQKLRDAFSGDKNPNKRPEVKEKQRLSHLGQPSPMKGRKHTQTSIEKMKKNSAAKRPEVRAKIKAARAKQVFSQETRAKWSASAKALWIKRKQRVFT